MNDEDETALMNEATAPKKRGRKKKQEPVITQTSLDVYMDTMVASISRLTHQHELELKGFKILLAAAALKLGGKITLSKEMLDLATEKHGDLKMEQDNENTRISL